MPKKATKKPKLKVVRSNKTSRSGKSLVQDKRYITRDSKGKFDECIKPPSGHKTTSSKSKADKMFEKVWKDTYERRERRVD